MDLSSLGPAGARLGAMLGKLRSDELNTLTQRGQAAGSDRQPWVVFGMSDGMGLRITLAALKSGILTRGVGIYFEPPFLLEVDDDGTPVSPVHHARRQNALALAEFAKQVGADFRVVSANCVLASAPKQDKPLPKEVADAVEEARSASTAKDVILIDSIAFSRWICPTRGIEPLKDIPSVNFDGEIVLMEMQPYVEGKYEDTINSMGRNHGALLRAALAFGWLGPRSISTFPTWAGGSQDIRVMKGVYGGGVLGDAKILAENELVRFRVEDSARKTGHHVVVRYPAFLSAALFGIPGGGLCGLVERKLLQEMGLYADMEELATRTLLELFGPHWVRDNALAQVQLDYAEMTYIGETVRRMTEVEGRIQEFLAANPGQRPPLPYEVSRKLLEGRVPDDYRDLLSGYRAADVEDTVRS